MALLLPKYRAIFFHLPKTGGTFISNYLTKVTEVKYLGYKHSPVDLVGKIAYEDYYKFCFIREPAEWYRSYFQMRVGQWGYWEEEMLWHPCWEIDPWCGSDYFETFVENCLQLDGYLDRLFMRYMGEGRLKMDFVGRTESLTDDFCQVMSEIGMEHSKWYVKSLPEENSCGKKIEFPLGLRDKINEHECRSICNLL